MTHVRFATVFRELLVMAAALLLSFLLAACDGSNKVAAAPASEAVAAHVGERHAAEAPVDHSAHAAEGRAAEGHAAAAPADHSGHSGHAGHQEALAAAELPGASLFHLAGAFTAQDGAEFHLSELRGKPTVAVMFYGDCTTACPLLVKAARDIEAALPPEAAASTQFLMVSFDTARDTPAKLRAYAEDKGLDKDRWHWLVGSPLLTRQLATLLGVQYRDGGNGVFAHSNLVTALDPDGVPIARIEGLGAALDPAVAAVKAALR